MLDMIDVKEKVVGGTETCVFHSKYWRSKLQYVVNELYGKVLPRNYSRRLSKVVCTCPEGNGFPDIHFEEWRKEGIANLKTYFDTIFSNPKSQLSNVHTVLEECLGSECQMTFESRWRLLVLIQQCMQKNYSIFKATTNAKTLEKKQKWNYDMEIQTSFPMEYVRFILGAKGRYIKKLCEENNCEIRFDIARHSYRPSYHFGRAAPAAKCVPVKIQLFYNALDTPVDVRDALFHHIARVVAKREKHKEKVFLYKERGREYQNKRFEKRLNKMMYEQRTGHRIGPVNSWGAAVNHKSHLTADYQLKAQKMQKLKNSKKQQKAPPVLEGGCCRNCLQPFKRNTFKKEACKFHPGFLVIQKANEETESSEQSSVTSSSSSSSKAEPVVKTNKLREPYVWSCCGEVVEGDNTVVGRQESHMETGCYQTVHDYRLPKTSNPMGRKANGSDNNLQDMDF